MKEIDKIILKDYAIFYPFYSFKSNESSSDKINKFSIFTLMIGLKKLLS